MAVRSCSNCSGDGRRRCRACSDAGDSGGGGIMLFGVRLTEAPLPAAMRKSASLGNLAQYEQPADTHADAGYASDDVLHHSGRSRERKRGVPWTEEEHRRFLQGLRIVGKGDWRAIARQYVKTRTPTQVASHAQKYYLRRNNNGRRRRRSSLFDITTDNFQLTRGEEAPIIAWGASGFNAAAPEDNAESMNVLRPTPKIPTPPRSLDLDLNEKLTIEPSSFSLNLPPPISSLPPSNPKPMLPRQRHSAFHSVPSFNGGNLNSKPGDAIFVT